jgi:hypothetical protein
MMHNEGAMRRVSFFLVWVVATLVLGSRPARAAAPSPELMAKLSTYASQFDGQLLRASFAVEGRMDLLDSDGKLDSRKELKAHVDPVVAGGPDVRVTVIRYLEDGHDKTGEAIDKAREADEKRRKRRQDNKQLKMPIRADQQGRYVFDQVRTDAATSRALITFVPKEPDDDTIEGSAWVDTDAGTIVSTGFKMSKRPMFVDHIHVTVEFGEPTSLGPAVSKVTVDGAGGVLFFHKHFVVNAVLSGYRIAP